MSTTPNVPRKIDVFWGEIAPSEHLVQIYADERAFLDSIEGFVGGGLQAGDSAIVIATAKHRQALEDRLVARGVQLAEARESDQYIALDAEETLARFMVAGWPDDDRFNVLVNDLLTRARKSGRRVRAFGEMVAVLWARGDTGATVRLEYLWHKLCKTETFSLFCAYPRVGFTQDAAASISELCAAHSKVIDG